MKLQFMNVHMAAIDPKQGHGGLELIPSMIIDKGDKRIHQYGWRVYIPDQHIGILLPAPGIADKIEKVAHLAIITPQDSKQELTATFTLPDDLVHDYYQPGEVSAILIVIPTPRIEIEIAPFLSI